MYRLELVEKDVDFGEYIRDLARISEPIKDLSNLGERIESYLEDFEEELKSEEYYIKVQWYEIEKGN